MKKLDGKWIEGLDRFVALVESVERSEGPVTQMDVDLLLQQLRDLYMLTLDMNPCKYVIMEKPAEPDQLEQPQEEPAPELNPAAESTPALEPEPEPEPTPAPEPDPIQHVNPVPIPEMAVEIDDSEPKFAPDEYDDEPQPMPQEEMNDGLHFHDLFEPEPEPFVEPTPAPQPTPVPESVNPVPSPQPVPPAPLPEPEPAPEVPKSDETDGNQSKPVTSLIDFLHTPNSRRPQPAVRTLGDTLGQNTASRGDQFSSHSQHKVADLRDAININDKFSFMNELFRHNMKAYSDFILVLNSMSDRQQALDYVANIAQQYEWNMDSLAVKTFYAIFDRKF